MFTFKDGRGKAKAKKTSAMGTSDVSSMNAAERRKARRAAERLRAQKLEEVKMRKKESAMQTCPDDWLICPWCTKVCHKILVWFMHVIIVLY